MLRRGKSRPGRENERGIVIMLVAVVLLFVVGAMAALAIDVVTLYTARSEAQLAADGAALAGARVFANSGMTSGADPVTAEPLVATIAKQVATSNPVGGRPLNPGTEVTVTFPHDGDSSFPTNPRVTVQTRRADLPAFFARIWGNTALTVSATATAEAYNPSGMNALGKPTIPVAPACVKPWLLPNIDPTNAIPNSPIFDTATGAIHAGSNLLGATPTPLLTDCAAAGCTAATAPAVWKYYPGDTTTSFPSPNASSVVCSGCVGFNAYQLSVAGCVQPPVSCGAPVNIDTLAYGPTRDADTVTAVNAMTHSIANGGDNVDTLGPSPPFQFVAGANTPAVQSGAVGAGTDVMVSDSLVTVPVVDTTTWPTGFPSVQIVGFIQLFLNPTGNASITGIQNQVINLAGCGTTATISNPILGNGVSPVAVRLITGP